MKISRNTLQETRSLVAVIGVGGNNLWLRNDGTKNAVLLRAPIQGTPPRLDAGATDRTLEEIAGHAERQPVYQGDTITIQF